MSQHISAIVPGSTRRSAVGGVEFVVRCCGVHEKSVHIQNPGKYTPAELTRTRQQHLDDVAREHADHEAAIAFLKQDESAKGSCGCA